MLNGFKFRAMIGMEALFLLDRVMAFVLDFVSCRKDP
jgi:hypothetical protein